MKNATHITLILDRSGSMNFIRGDVIGGVNAFIKEQKETPGECSLTLVQFDSTNPYEVICDHLDIKDVKNLGDEYRPRGMTPLYDAVGRGILKTGEYLGNLPEHERPDKVIFVTMTDGAENHSKEFDSEKVKAMTKEQQEKYNWKFMYLGADHDAMKAGDALGIVNAANYGKANFQGAMRTSSKKMAEYRTSGNASGMAWSAADREAMK